MVRARTNSRDCSSLRASPTQARAGLPLARSDVRAGRLHLGSESAARRQSLRSRPSPWPSSSRRRRQVRSSASGRAQTTVDVRESSCAAGLPRAAHARIRPVEVTRSCSCSSCASSTRRGSSGRRSPRLRASATGQREARLRPKVALRRVGLRWRRARWPSSRPRPVRSL